MAETFTVQDLYLTIIMSHRREAQGTLDETYTTPPKLESAESDSPSLAGEETENSDSTVNDVKSPLCLTVSHMSYIRICPDGQLAVHPRMDHNGWWS